MYISAYKERQSHQLLKTALVYLAVSALCFLIDKIYALFGHGVSSPAMTWLFLYPLLGGALVFILLRLLAPVIAAKPRYRIAYNLYNSGIATLIVGSMLQGVFEIAGTSSPYTIVFYIVGGLMLVAGVVALQISKQRR